MLMANCLPKSDGILSLTFEDDYGNYTSTHLLKVMLTDSGHYLLPTNRFDDDA